MLIIVSGNKTQIKNIMSYYYIPIRMPEAQKDLNFKYQVLSNIRTDLHILLVGV